MLQKLKITEILQDQSRGFEIEGEIKKICIHTKQDLANVYVRITTSDNEVLFSNYVGKGQYIYPKIIYVQDNVVVCKSNPILMGVLRFDITGMIEEQRIDSISVIIDKSEALRGTDGGTF